MLESKQLHTDGIINDEQLNAIEQHEDNKLFTIQWELRTILYLGILLLTTGIGILVYENIDTIGHQVVLVTIVIACSACFFYSFRHRTPYTNEESIHPSPFYDYIILLGCLLFAILIGYVQYQYGLFGTHYGIATLIPAVLFFFCAYLFDHKGILSLGITGLAAWVGLTVTPMQLLQSNNFSNGTIILTAMGLGVVITAFAKFAEIRNIKKHFSFTYNNFAANILYVATLAALFDQPLKILSFLLLAACCAYFIKYAIDQHSFWFLLISVVYGYIGLTYSVFSLLIDSGTGGEIRIMFFSIFYLIGSCAGVIMFFIKYKQILGIKK